MVAGVCVGLLTMLPLLPYAQLIQMMPYGLFNLLAVIGLPGILCGMALSRNVHAFYTSVAVIANVVFYTLLFRVLAGACMRFRGARFEV